MIWLLFLPLALFITLVLGAWCGFHGLTLDRTIKLSDISGLLATTLVAVVLQYVLQKRGKATDIEKDLLTSQVSEIIGYLGETRTVVAKQIGKPLTKSDASEVVQAFEMCSDALSSLEFCVSQSHCKSLVSNCHAVGQSFLLYKRAITGANFPSTPISQNDFATSSLFRGQIDRRLRLLSLQVSKA